MRDLLVLGANSPDIIRIIEDINEDVSIKEKINLIGFLDNDRTKQHKKFLGKYEILGTPDDILGQKEFSNVFLVNNIYRDVLTRMETTAQLKKYCTRFLSLVHPGINTSYVKIGQGVVVSEGCLINPGVIIDDHAALSVGAIVGHDCIIGSFCIIGPSVQICGNVIIQEEVYVGACAAILPRIVIGKGTTLGAGTMITKNIEANKFVIGNPFRVTSLK